MKTAALSVLVLASMLLAPSLGAQEVNVYKWVDENGVPQYTDRPPLSGEAQMTGMRSRRTDPAAVQAQKTRQNEAASQAAENRNASGEANAQSAAERRETKAQRSANCEQARTRLETYDTARRLYRPLPNGEREYLTDDELTQARNDARTAVSEWCD